MKIIGRVISWVLICALLFTNGVPEILAVTWRMEHPGQQVITDKQTGSVSVPLVDLTDMFVSTQETLSPEQTEPAVEQ